MSGLMTLLEAQGGSLLPALQDGTTVVSRAELARRVNALAQQLRQRGIRRLALHADNRVDWVIADLACMEAGILCVPIPLFFSKMQLLHVLHACGIDALVTPTPDLYAAHFRAVLDVDGLGPTLLQSAARQPQVPEGTAKVTFTSGSTGAPKGVCLTAAQQVLQAQALVQTVGMQQPRHLCVLPLSTLLENIAGVYAPLLAGGTVNLRGMAELGFTGSRLADPRKFLQAIGAAQPNTLILIPQLLQLLVHAVKQGWQPPLSLNFIAVGGARVSAQLIDEARRLRLPVYEGYGLSECASVVSLNTPQADAPGSSGKPLPHLELSFEEGEVHVSGNTMLGYVDEPGSWYRKRTATGDLGFLDAAGFLHISGRSKNLLINSYGRNISPEWVESELLASAALSEAVVLGDARPHCVALLSPARPDLDDTVLAAAVAAANLRLPDYAQVKQWLRLPRPLAGQADLITPNGKPRRGRIEQAWHAEIEALYGSAMQALQEEMP